MVLGKSDFYWVSLFNDWLKSNQGILKWNHETDHLVNICEGDVASMTSWFNFKIWRTWKSRWTHWRLKCVIMCKKDQDIQNIGQLYHSHSVRPWMCPNKKSQPEKDLSNLSKWNIINLIKAVSHNYKLSCGWNRGSGSQHIYDVSGPESLSSHSHISWLSHWSTDLVLHQSFTLTGIPLERKEPFGDEYLH